MATSHSRDGQHAPLLHICEIFNDLMSFVRTMPPRREPRRSSEPTFPDVAQLGEAIAYAFQNIIRPPPPPPQRTPLESVHNLKITPLAGNEGPEGSEKWFMHIEKTFDILTSQGSLQQNKWVETTKWFLSKEPASWWTELAKHMPEEQAND